MNKILQQPILLLWFRVPAKLLFEPTDVPGGYAKDFGDGVRLLPCFKTGQDTSFERFTTAQVGHDDLHPPQILYRGPPYAADQATPEENLWASGG